MNPTPARGRRGFTLIELLVATVLAALLIGGLVLAAGALGRDARRFEAAADPASRVDAAVALLRRDLANAHAVTFAPDGSAALVGDGGIDPRTLRPTGRLVRTEYRLVAVAARGRPGDAAGPGALFVREQRPLDGLAGERPWREVVAVGVNGFELSAASSDAQPLAGAGAGAGAGDPFAGAATVPSRVRLRVGTAGGNVDRVIQVR